MDPKPIYAPFRLLYCTEVAPRTHPVHVFEKRKKLFIFAESEEADKLEELKKVTAEESARSNKRRMKFQAQVRAHRDIYHYFNYHYHYYFSKGLRPGGLHGWQHRGVRKREEKKPLESSKLGSTSTIVGGRD